MYTLWFHYEVNSCFSQQSNALIRERLGGSQKALNMKCHCTTNASEKNYFSTIKENYRVIITRCRQQRPE